MPSSQLAPNRKPWVVAVVLGLFLATVLAFVALESAAHFRVIVVVGLVATNVLLFQLVGAVERTADESRTG